MQGLFQTFCVRYPQAMLFFIFCSIFCSLNKDGVLGGGGDVSSPDCPNFIDIRQFLLITNACSALLRCVLTFMHVGITILELPQNIHCLVSNVFEVAFLRACLETTHLEQFTYAFHHVPAFCLMRNLIILCSLSFPLSKNEWKIAFWK